MTNETDVLKRNFKLLPDFSCFTSAKTWDVRQPLQHRNYRKQTLHESKEKITGNSIVPMFERFSAQLFPLKH